MAKSLLLVTALAGAASAVSDGSNDSSICVSSSGTYTMRVNLFASELGKPSRKVAICVPADTSFCC
jgi:hypothetical protein